MSLADIQSAHLRAAILQVLREGTRANDAVLHTAVGQMEGITASRDQVRGALRWLGEQGLVEIEAAGDYLVGRIRQRGLDFLAGAIVVDGVHRQLS
jgi:DNA-binding GntR family transcriptional regulator